MNIKKIIACSTMILGMSTLVYAEPFSDVYPSHWAYEAVTEMAQKGIVQGWLDLQCHRLARLHGDNL